MVETVILGSFQIVRYGSIIIEEKNGHVNIWFYLVSTSVLVKYIYNDSYHE